MPLDRDPNIDDSPVQPSATVTPLPTGMARLCISRARELEDIAKLLEGSPYAATIKEIASDVRLAGDHLHAYDVGMAARREEYLRMRDTMTRWTRGFDAWR